MIAGFTRADMLATSLRNQRRTALLSFCRTSSRNLALICANRLGGMKPWPNTPGFPGIGERPAFGHSSIVCSDTMTRLRASPRPIAGLTFAGISIPIASPSGGVWVIGNRTKKVVSFGCRWRRRDRPVGAFPDHVPLPLHGSGDHRSGRQGPARERPPGLLTSGVRRARHAPRPSRPVRRRRSPPGSHRRFGCCAWRPPLACHNAQPTSVRIPAGRDGNLDRPSPGPALKLAELAFEFQDAGLTKGYPGRGARATNRVRSYLCMGLFCDFSSRPLPCTAEGALGRVRDTGPPVSRALREGSIQLQHIMLWPRH
jgi:hypothetical protein